MKNVSLILLLSLLCLACTRDYHKELTKLAEQYQKEGRDVIAISEAKHFVVYKDGDAFWINNLDEPARILISANNKIRKKTYFLTFNKSGIPIVEEDRYVTEVELDPSFFEKNRNLNYEVGHAYPYTESDIKLFDDKALIFNYSKICEDIRGGGDNYVSKSQYILYFSNPNVLFKTNAEPRIGEDGNRIDEANSAAGDLASSILPIGEEGDKIFPYRYGYNQSEGGYFKCFYSIDSVGNTSDLTNFEYYNDQYNKQMSFRALDFSTREKAIKVLKTINDTITICQKRDYIEKLFKEAVTLEKLSKEFANPKKLRKNILEQLLLLNVGWRQSKKQMVFLI